MPKYNFKNVCLICLWVFFPFFAAAQRSTGLIEEAEDIEKQSLMSLYDGSKEGQLPRSVDLRPYCPKPGNQGALASCVGWSVGYAAMTIEYAILNNWIESKRTTDEAFSAMFLYNQININPMDCKRGGSGLSQAMEFLKTKGNCLAKEFDFNTDDCQKKPDPTLLSNAEQYSIKEGIRLFDNKASNEVKINNIRTLLSKKKPVIISLKTNLNFQEIKNAEFWYPSSGDEPNERHALVIVGYDDDAACFFLMNSWGTNWGKNGFIKIKYNDLAKYCQYAFVIYLNTDKSAPIDLSTFNTTSSIKYDNLPNSKATIVARSSNNNPPASETVNTKSVASPSQTKPIARPTTKAIEEMSGQFDVNLFVGWAGADPIFKPVEIERVSNHYEFKKKDWIVGQQFQLVLTSDNAGAYVYVVSFNARNEVKILFPRNEDFGAQYKGLHETPLMMLDGARILLPGPKKVMKIDGVGTDRVCIFFSSKKIFGFPELCKMIQNHKGDLDTYIPQLLQGIMVPTSDTNFSDNKISFSSATRSGGVIVPIIVEVQSR